MIAVTCVPGSHPQWRATSSLAPFGQLDQKLPKPIAVAPSNRFWMPAATASRFSSVCNSLSPGAVPTTMMTGARRYLVRVFSTLFSASPRRFIASAATSPRPRRDSPVKTPNRHGQVCWWFGAQAAASHSFSTSFGSTSRVWSITSCVRREMTSARKSSKVMTSSCAVRR